MRSRLSTGQMLMRIVGRITESQNPVGVICLNTTETASSSGATRVHMDHAVLFAALLNLPPFRSELASRGDSIVRSRIKPVGKLVIRGIVCQVA